jgi:ketosteroid isomerase-like protein
MTRFERDQLYRKASKCRTSKQLGSRDLGRIEDDRPTESEGRTEDDGRTGDDIHEEWSATQKQVWGREETYWELTAAGDVDRFMTLWDDRFVEWPDAEETPITVSEPRPGVADWSEDARSNEFSYTLDPLAIAVSGNVGVTYYRVRTAIRAEDGEETAEYRTAHTWRKTGEEWKLVGGMSAPILDE